MNRQLGIVPFWAICAVFFTVSSVSVTLVVSSFMANIPTQQEQFNPTFIDASPRSCGPNGQPIKNNFSIRSTIWLVAAVWLSSGLCAIHPLQSGLILGF